MHAKKCKKFISSYKKTCKDLWSAECAVNMTDAQLDDMALMAQMCMYARIKYSDECLGGRNNSAHLGAIKKMEKIATRCNKIKNKKKDDDQYLSDIRVGYEKQLEEAEKKEKKGLSKGQKERARRKRKIEREKEEPEELWINVEERKESEEGVLWIGSQERERRKRGEQRFDWAESAMMREDMDYDTPVIFVNE
uniref:Uncharacterized protein n=1 Tax=Marseillevirus LCMAC101 TaxID=2506602 RepID=A0A481YS82_9VIRU|nr:MAG: hypothetical protein LCMAC101_06630 [Marseillevirus LCMAC101]